MREILFRGKRLDNGEWVDGSLVHRTQFYGNPDNKYFILTDGEFDCDYYDAPQVDPDTVGQYTGLTDKNGMRIFDGDIIRIECTDGYIPEIYGPYEVRWHSEWLKWVYSNEEDKRGYFFEDLGELTYEDCEVIGNIHDNPELLNGGADDNA